MNNRVPQRHLARKRFGQNFLDDQFVIDRALCLPLTRKRARRWSKSARYGGIDRTGRRTSGPADGHRT
ncbi:hypothetical protein ACVXHB_22770 [Escherichia coli]